MNISALVYLYRKGTLNLSVVSMWNGIDDPRQIEGLIKEYIELRTSAISGTIYFILLLALMCLASKHHEMVFFWFSIGFFILDIVDLFRLERRILKIRRVLKALCEDYAALARWKFFATQPLGTDPREIREDGEKLLQEYLDRGDSAQAEIIRSDLCRFSLAYPNISSYGSPAKPATS